MLTFSGVVLTFDGVMLTFGGVTLTNVRVQLFTRKPFAEKAGC
jgi:hypothetical protein